MPLTVHFLNVGHGDCTFIEHPSGRITMIDINNSKSLPDSDVDALAEAGGMSVGAFRSRLFAPRGYASWEAYYLSLLVDPVDYFHSTFGAWASVFRYLQTHPDMDHMSGLHRFFWQEKIEVTNFWDTEHTKVMKEEDFEGSRYNYADWLVYQLMRTGALDDDRRHTVLHLVQGAQAPYYADDNISILGPTPALLDEANRSEAWNNSSYVIRVEHAGRVIILPGDAEQKAWDSIEALHDPDYLACDVLKAAHHGRESGYSESATKTMKPDFVICSVGKKPSTDASDEYAKHGATVLSTRANGTIKLTIDDTGGIEIVDHAGALLGSAGARHTWLTA